MSTEKMLIQTTARPFLDGGLPDDWSEASPGGLASNPDPITGGIIDRNIASGEWFVIFHNEALPTLEGIATRDQAVAAFMQTMMLARAFP